MATLASSHGLCIIPLSLIKHQEASPKIKGANGQCPQDDPLTKLVNQTLL